MLAYLVYIDPGSGSYLVQAIIAAVLGAMFYFKTIWWRIKSFFTKNKEDQDTSISGDPNDHKESTGESGSGINRNQ